jgi:ankyrin repeat protein
MGIAIPTEKIAISNDPDENKELRRLMLLAENSPNRVWKKVPLALNNTGSQTSDVLSKAARQGWVRMVTWLLDYADETNFDVYDNGNPLNYAAEAGQLEICTILVERGANIESANGVLTKVILEQHDDLGKWLIKKEIDINDPGDGYLTAVNGHTETGFDHLTGEEYTRPKRASCKLTPLAAAISIDDKIRGDCLLAMKPDLNVPSSFSPLATACWKGHAPLVRHLLADGADPKITAHPEYSPFTSIRGQETRARGWTPLHYGAGNPEIIADLLKAGADPLAADSVGLTPLFCAAHLGNLEAVRILIDAGADALDAGKVTGIGLAIVKHTVKAHNATITIKDKTPGTRITINVNMGRASRPPHDNKRIPLTHACAS